MYAECVPPGVRRFTLTRSALNEHNLSEARTTYNSSVRSPPSPSPLMHTATTLASIRTCARSWPGHACLDALGLGLGSGVELQPVYSAVDSSPARAGELRLFAGCACWRAAHEGALRLSARAALRIVSCA
jgi:hypothetical protein